MERARFASQFQNVTKFWRFASVCLVVWLANANLAFGQTPKNGKLELVVESSHGGIVYSAALSPDKKILASAGENIILRDAADGKFIKQLGGEEPTGFIVFSPDGKILAGCSLGDGPGTLTLWDVNTGEQIRRWAGSFYGDNKIAFSPDGKLLATTYIDGSVTIWNVQKGKIKEFQAHEIALSVAFSPDGSVLASSGQDDKDPIKIWDVKTWSLLGSLKGHEKIRYGILRVWSVEFSPDGRTLASSSFDNTVRLWDWKSGKTLETLRGHSNLSIAIAFSPDGKIIATSGAGQIKLWDTASGGLLRTLGEKKEKLDSNIVLLKFIGHGKILISSTENEHDLSDGGYTWWNIETGEPTRTLLSRKIYSVALLTGATLSVTLTSGTKLLNLADIKDLKSIAGDSRLVSHKSGDAGEDLIIRVNNKTIKILPEYSGLRLLDVEANEKEIARIILPVDNEWAVVTSDGRFDASESAQKFMHYTYGLEVINLEQLKEMYYEPGLLQKLLGYSKDSLRPIVPLKDIKLYPEILQQTFDEKTARLTVTLKSRGGGVGRIEVFVNGQRIVKDARDEMLIQNPDVRLGAIVTLTVDLRNVNIFQGGENKITVITSNYLKEIASGNVKSRGSEILYLHTNKIQDTLPSLYAIVGGVSDYDGDNIDLRFAAKDAEDFSQALSLGARRLFCPKEDLNCLDRVQIKTLSTDRQNEDEQPTKENFRKAFADLALKAEPEDIVVIYLAGHGVTFGAGTDTYFFLTKESRSAGKDDLTKVYQTAAISSEELTDWLTLDNNKPSDISVKAQKKVLILDTCAAGNFAGSGDWKNRELSGDQIRAMDFLTRNTGTFVLMSSAANQPSYEASKYNQGILTYALLEGMKGRALQPATNNIDVRILLGYAEQRVPELAKDMSLEQRPIIKQPAGNNFVIGQMTEAEKRKIKLPVPKPLLLRPLLTSPKTGDDDLSLIPKLRKMLDAESSYEVARRSGNGEPAIVYIDDDSFPGAVRVTGTYTVEGDTVRLKALLRRDGKTVATLPEIVAAKDLALSELFKTVCAELSTMTFN